MLSKHNRLTAREVREILKRGKTLRAPSLVAKYVSGTPAKFAVVISKKVAKKATERNKIRRAIYGALSPDALTSHVVLLVGKNSPDFSSDIKAICSKLT